MVLLGQVAKARKGQKETLAYVDVKDLLVTSLDLREIVVCRELMDQKDQRVS